MIHRTGIRQHTDVVKTGNDSCINSATGMNVTTVPKCGTLKSYC